ncbi:MAG: hypothetical protein WCK96_07595 [Methylococcales bacterium]
MAKDVFERAESLGLINDGQKSSLQSAASFLGEIAAGVGYVNTAIGIASFLGQQFGLFSAEPSPIELLSKQINELRREMLEQFRIILETSEEDFKIEWERDIAEEDGDIMGALATLAEYPPEHPDFLVYAADVPINVFSALETIEHEAFWQRTHYPQTDFDHPWDPKPPPLEGGKRVWDYRYTLPVYLKSMVIYIAVIGICNKEAFLLVTTGIENPADPDLQAYRASAQAIRSQIEERISFLRNAHYKIRDAIEEIRRPSVEELRYEQQVRYDNYHDTVDILAHVTFTYYCALNPIWYKNDCLYGVVEKHTSSCSLDMYPENELPPAPALVYSEHDLLRFMMRILPGQVVSFSDWYYPEMDIIYIGFKAKHAVRTLKQWKKLYNELGLPEVWETMNYLRKIIREEPEVVDGRDGIWSLREVDNVVGIALYNSPTSAQQGEPISVRKLASLLNVSPLTSLRQMYES